MNSMDDIRYEAFFDELGQLEKRSMMEKVAIVGALKGAWKGAKNLYTGGLKSGVGKVVDAYKSGFATAGPGKSGIIPGVKSALKTNEGKALALGAAGVGAAGLGIGGVGYLHGRSTAAPRH